MLTNKLLGVAGHMESIFSFFENLFKNFTWGRLTFLVAILLLSTGGLLAYEFYTGHFKLNRISSELQIIERIVEIEKKVDTLPESSPSKKYFNRLMSEADNKPVEFNFQPGFSSQKIERIFFQSLPWLLLAALAFFATANNRNSAVAGIIALGSPFIVLGYNLPAFEPPWIINYAYPWGTLVVILSLILIWQGRKNS